MIPAKFIYESASLDDANKEENGSLNYDRFNRISKRAELFLIKMLTGDLIVTADDFPKLNAQKNRDYLSRFIERKRFAGDFVAPENYFTYELLYRLGVDKSVNCETNEVKNKITGCNTAITIMDGAKFTSRCQSHIKSLRPSTRKPICQITKDRTFEIMPKNIGTIELQYIRYPRYAQIVSTVDTVFNIDVIDEVNSTNFEWDEWAIEPLIWFIVNKFSTHTREQNLKQITIVEKVPRG